MQETFDPLPADILEVMRSLVAAIRAVKLYPPNNPIYAQSIKKSAEILGHFLENAPEYPLVVQKNDITYGYTTAGKDIQLNRSVAQDLFAKGIREVVFSTGVTEEELLVLFQAFALSPEEMAMKSGVASLLWEQNCHHIKVVEAGLSEILSLTDEAKDGSSSGSAEQDRLPSGQMLVLGHLLTNPAGFGAALVQQAKETKKEEETLEDRLFVLYQETGRSIREQHPEKIEEMFDGLAESALSLEPSVRDSLIGDKLYRDLDSDTAKEQKDKLEEHIPNELHEVLSGRFSNVWNMKQVSHLLKKSSEKDVGPVAVPVSPSAIEPVLIPPDLDDTARDIAEYTSEERAVLQAMTEIGLETDIVEAAVRTLIFLLSQVKNPLMSSPEKELNDFCGVVHQLEEMLAYLLKQKDYMLAALIIQAFHMPVDPAFQPRLDEALKKSVSKNTITQTLKDIRNYNKASAEYTAARAYLSIFERETTEIMLELLAEETDRSTRLFLLDLIKGLGKDQVEVLSSYLADPRWYVVRNVVNILAESKSEQVLPFFQKPSRHPDIRIRQEVARGLISIGGKKAASFLALFLDDPDDSMQLMAIRSFAILPRIGSDESRYLTAFLENLQLRKKDQPLILEAIKVLGKIGGPETADFLKRYTRIRWWRSRKAQVERRNAARTSMDEIQRRLSNGGPAGHSV
ncbi:MAG: HEAT repeat domain-containing protein [Nitrospirota bacterium]